MREPLARLEDILDAVEAIEKYARLGKREFFNNELIRSWCLLQILVIGEATNHLRDEKPAWLSAHPEIPWDEIVAMRNRLVHGYFEIQLDIVWDAIERDIPNLKVAVMGLLRPAK